MIYAFGTISSCVVTGLVFFRVMDTLYERKYINRKYIYYLSYVLYVLLSVAISYANIPLVNIIFSMAILCSLSYLFYNVHGKNVVINSSIVIIYLAIADLLVTTFISSMISSSTYFILQQPKYYFVSGIADSLVMLCTNGILIQFLFHYRISKISKILYIYMIFLLIFEMWILCHTLIINADKASNAPLVLISIGFIVVDGGILYLYKMVSQNALLEKQAGLLEQQREMTVKYYEELHDRYTKTQKLLHDIKKHISVLDELKNDEEILKREYAKELMDTIKSIQQQFTCSDPIVSAIIWDKIQTCQRENISFDVNMQDIEFDFMDKMEVTILFANLLDNAIESCQRIEHNDKKITLRVHRFKDFIVIRMKNSISKMPNIKNGELISTKTNHMGMGILILKELANKYYGNLNYDYSTDYFETKIILSIIRKE